MSLIEPPVQSHTTENSSAHGMGLHREAAHKSALTKRLSHSTAFVTLLVIAGFVCAWWIAATYLVRDPVLLPSPSGFSTRFAQLIKGASFWQDVKASTERAVIGWGVGVTAGILVGTRHVVRRL